MTHPLLTPRYIVEADYPNSPFRVGDVLELSDTTTLNGQTVYYKKYPPIHLEVDMLNKYPHIFRPMHWSEQRELGEMPKYVKGTSGRVIKANWTWSEQEKCYLAVYGYSNKHLTPATEAEYLEYLKSKEK